MKLPTDAIMKTNRCVYACGVSNPQVQKNVAPFCCAVDLMFPFDDLTGLLAFAGVWVDAARETVRFIDIVGALCGIMRKLV